MRGILSSLVSVTYYLLVTATMTVCSLASVARRDLQNKNNVKN